MSERRKQKGSPYPWGDHPIVALVSVIAGVATLVTAAQECGRQSVNRKDRQADVVVESKATPSNRTRRFDTPTEAPTQKTATPEDNDRDAIMEFRWKWLTAINALSTWGDFGPMMQISIDKRAPLSVEMQRKMDQLPALAQELMRREGTELAAVLDSWTIESIDGDEAWVAVTWRITGVDRGKPMEEKKHDRLRLAKLRGEWLMAPAMGGR